MTERVFIGRDNGVFKFRVSKPGSEARSASIAQLSIHEEMECVTPYEEGKVSVPAAPDIMKETSVMVALQRTYDLPPFIIIRCDKNWVPGPGTFFAEFRAGTQQLRLINRTQQPIVIKFCIFAELDLS